MSKATPYLAIGAIAGLAFFMVRSRNKRLAAEAEARAALAAQSGAGRATEILTSAMDLIEPEHVEAAGEYLSDAEVGRRARELFGSGPKDHWTDWVRDRVSGVEVDGFGYPSPSG